MVEDLQTIKYFSPMASDSDRLAELHVDCWKETYSDIIPAHILTNITTEAKAKMWKEIILYKSSSKIIIAGDEKKFFGFVCFDHAQIYAIYLKKEYQKKGIGSYLIKKAIDYARNNNSTELFLWVASANKTATSFYEKMGAREVEGKKIIYVESYPLEEIKYSWELS